MCSLDLEIISGMKICDACRKKVSDKYKTDDEVLPGSSKSLDDSFIDPQSSIDFFNKSLELISESLLKKKRVNVPSYTIKKLEKIKCSIRIKPSRRYD